jgi:hypothetical protein
VARKLVSLPSIDGFDSYTATPPGDSNRAIVSQSNTRWVKLWVDWPSAQPAEPADPYQSWAQLGQMQSPGGYFDRLDAQIRAVNNDSEASSGIGVFLGLFQTYPLWASGNTSGSRNPCGVPDSERKKLPLRADTNSPWAWFIAYLLARYKPGTQPPYGIYNPNGPNHANGPSGWYGNPRRAYVSGLEICNEPNLENWPQTDSNGAKNIHCTIGTMFETAEAYAYGFGPGCPALLGPGTSDAVDAGDPVDQSPQKDCYTRYYEFTDLVLQQLKNFQPRVPFYWSMHNYRDITNDTIGRFQTQVDLLRRPRSAGGWDPSPSAPFIITEGGYRLNSTGLPQGTCQWVPTGGSYPCYSAAQENTQAQKMQNAYGLRFGGHPNAYTFAQYKINNGYDPALDTFQTGLRAENGVNSLHDRPLRNTWAGLVAPNTP